jgi:hypothetical protein
MDKQVSFALFRVGDLVRYIGYHYSPDYIYIDGEDYNLGVIVEALERQVYQPIYRVYWFKKGFTTDAIQDHLRLVVINKQD